MLAARLAAGTLVFFAAAAGTALALFAADRLTFLPPAIRAAASAAFVIGATALLYVKVISTLLRPPDERDAARALERRFAALGDYALSAAELTLGPEARSSAPSGELVDLAVAEALRRAGPIAPSKAADRRAVLRPLWPFAAAAAGWLAVALLLPADVPVFVQRFAHPFQPIRYPARTRIAAVNAPKVLPLGAAFEAEAVAEGLLPEEAIFTVMPEGASSRKVYAAGEKGRYRLALESVREDFRFRVEAGDAAAGDFAVKVVARPEVVGISAEVRYPEYTGVGTLAVAGGNVTALAGSTATVEAVFNKPVESARIVFSDGGKAEGTLSEDRGSAKFEVAVDDRRSYRVALLDAYGFEPLDPPTYTVTPEEDRVPAVAVDRPGRDLTVVPGAILPVEVTASDDYGVTQLRLCFSVTRGGKAASEEVEVLADEAPHSKESRAQLTWNLAALELEPGDEVAYYAEAVDNVPTTPQAGRSDTRRAVVVSVEDKLAEIEQMNRQLQANLQAVARKQEEARKAVEAIAGEGG